MALTRQAAAVAVPRPRASWFDARAAIAVALIVLCVPLFLSELAVFKFGVVLIFFVAVIGLHILVNWVGQFSLAHAAMVGVPAFMVIAMSQAHGISPIYLLPVAVVLGAAVGALVALPTLRAKDLQVVVVTLIANAALLGFFSRQRWLIGAAGTRTAALTRLGPLHLKSSQALYPVLAVVAVAATVAAWMLSQSKLRRAWLWIRSDSDAAAAFGTPVVLYKIGAYAVGGAFAGLAGGMSVMWIQSFSSNAFSPTDSFAYLLVAVVAGPGFLGGVALITLGLQGGPQFLGGPLTSSLLAYGGPLLLVDGIARQHSGFNGTGRRVIARLRARYGPDPDAGDGRPTREQPAYVIPLAVIAGVGAIVAGFVAIALAWDKASVTNQLWIQNQYILSGGGAGLGLILIGVAVLVWERLGQSQKLLARHLAATPSAATAEGEALPTAEPPVYVIPLAVIAGVGAIVAGFVAIAVAWDKASVTNQLWIQNQYILSGGGAGLGLILIGVAVLVWERLGQSQKLLARHLAATLPADDAGADVAASARDATAPANGAGRRAKRSAVNADPEVPVVEPTRTAPTNGSRSRRERSVK